MDWNPNFGRQYGYNWYFPDGRGIHQGRPYDRVPLETLHCERGHRLGKKGGPVSPDQYSHRVWNKRQRLQQGERNHLRIT